MEVFTKTCCSHKVTILYDGGHYVFQTDAHGVIAVATRKSFDEDGMYQFTLFLGTPMHDGSRLQLCNADAFARREISAIENRYSGSSPRTITFDKRLVDLSRFHVSLFIQHD